MSVLFRCLRGGLFAILFAAHCPFALAASATLDRISSGTIHLAYADGAAPFWFRERGGSVRGDSVELCEQVAQRIGKTLDFPSLNVERKPVDASTRLDALSFVDSDFSYEPFALVVLGAAGGAGYAKRPNADERPRWEIRVRMDGGSVRVVSHAYEPSLREGDRVRVYGTQLELISA